MVERGAGVLDAAVDPAGEGARAGVTDADRRRFTRAALIAIAVAAVPFVWVLWWNGQFPDPLRTAWPSGSFSNFYDLQARALANGHWWVQKGELGIEAFVVEGKEYTYFGPFGAALRAPVFAITSDLDGELTAPSMLLAWAVTAVFLPVLVWRVRLLVRGSAALGRAETLSLGVLIATVLGGSVLVYLAAMPWVYHEDFAWSVALTTGVLFALIGVLERPTTWRVVATGGLTLAAVLNRVTTGWACVIAVGLTALWFATGRGGEENRRWWRPTLAAALLPLAAGCAVTWMKFGTPFGLPMASQVFTKVNAHRREFLAANGGRAFNLEFLPSTLLAYFRPDGLRLSFLYPFITRPAEPAGAVGGVVLDQTYRTGSIPASMPLLFGLATWGVVSVFRRGTAVGARLLRIPLLGAAAACAGVLVWGYIAHRYHADFLPLLILGGTIGLIDVWRRLEGRSHRVRAWAAGIVAALGVFGIVVNLALASAPADRESWRGIRARDYVELKRTIGDFIGHPVTGDVVRVDHLPRTAPADQLFVVGDCDLLYLATGEPEHPWIPIDYTDGFTHPLDVTFREPLGAGQRIPLLVVESSVADGRFYDLRKGERFVSRVYAEGDGAGQVRFGVDDPFLPTVAEEWIPVEIDRPYRVRIVADTGTHAVTVRLDRRTVHEGETTASGGQRVVRHGPRQSGPLAVDVVSTVPKVWCAGQR